MVVALHREARVVRQLIGALDRLDSIAYGEKRSRLPFRGKYTEKPLLNDVDFPQTRADCPLALIASIPNARYCDESGRTSICREPHPVLSETTELRT